MQKRVQAVFFGLLLGAAILAPHIALAGPVTNNGVIRVDNTTNYTVGILLKHFLGQGESDVIPPHSTFYSRICCYLAGSPYTLRVHTQPNKLPVDSISFQPHLCNNGHPYGYAHLIVGAKPISSETDAFVLTDTHTSACL